MSERVLKTCFVLKVGAATIEEMRVVLTLVDLTVVLKTAVTLRVAVIVKTAIRGEGEGGGEVMRCFLSLKMYRGTRREVLKETKVENREKLLQMKMIKGGREEVIK